MTSESIYPIVLGNGIPTILDDVDLLRYIREKCGFEISEAVKRYIVGLETEDLDNLDDCAAAVKGAHRDLEDACAELESTLKYLRARLNV